jgi:hypothetical protein
MHSAEPLDETEHCIRHFRVFDYDCDRLWTGLMRRLQMVTVVAVASSLPFHPWLLTPPDSIPRTFVLGRILVSDDEDDATPKARGADQEAGHSVV